jgi:two-component system, OmpR family, response regulator ResD
MAHILAVDDDKGARNLIKIMLTREGFEVTEARDANEALSLLNDFTPDLIILDVMMPGMNGVDLCKVLRERTDTARLPILILSTLSDMKTVLNSVDAGATDYLPKPIYHNDLKAKVKGLLEASA